MEQNSTNKLFEYYSIKKLYEDKIDTLQNDLIKNVNYTWKEKRAILSTKIPSCVNCKRNVGTIFSRNINSENMIVLKAVCGDRQSPCPLNIELEIDYAIEYIPDVVDEHLILVNIIKNNIIKYKNDIVFGYENIDTEKFSSLQNSLEEIVNYLNYLIDKLVKLNDNYENKLKLNELNEIFYSQIDEIKSYLNMFKSTNEEKYIKEAVNIYIDFLDPLVKNIRNLKYKYVNVEIIDNKYELIEKQNLITDYEEKPLDYIKVISFVRGMTTEKNKTKKIRPTEKQTLLTLKKNKTDTKKNRK